jgi:hypothetical protein
LPHLERLFVLVSFKTNVRVSKMQDPSQSRWRQFETNLFKRVARGKKRSETPDRTPRATEASLEGLA